jgi:transcription termination factor NusB
MKMPLTPVAAGLIFFILSCSSSQITSRWAEKGLKAKKYNKILVLGIMNNNETSLRGKIEKHIVGDLKDIDMIKRNVLIKPDESPLFDSPSK